MKTYVTFGFDHSHKFNGKTFDKDCVAVITCDNPEHGRKLAFAYFDRQFCMEYPESYFPFNSMHFYPRGFIEVSEHANS